MIRYLVLIFILVDSVAAIAQNQRIGCINSDSLLLLMPGFKENLDSTTAEQRMYREQVIKFDQMHAQKRHEIDSMSSKDSPLIHKLREEQLRQIAENKKAYEVYGIIEINRNDSIRRAPYQKKLDDACLKVAEQQKCDKVLNRADAHSIWPADKTTFVELNAEVAKELGL